MKLLLNLGTKQFQSRSQSTSFWYSNSTYSFQWPLFIEVKKKKYQNPEQLNYSTLRTLISPKLLKWMETCHAVNWCLIRGFSHEYSYSNYMLRQFNIFCVLLTFKFFTENSLIESFHLLKFNLHNNTISSLKLRRKKKREVIKNKQNRRFLYVSWWLGPAWIKYFWFPFNCCFRFKCMNSELFGLIISRM